MTLLYTLDLIGTAAFAASGALAAVRRDMDMLGVLILGLVTATGGGTLRDMLLGDLPPFIFKDETYLYLAGSVSLLVFFFCRLIERLKKPLLLFDALGLGTFVVIGTSKALSFQLGFLGAVTMGVMTATAGGLVRDVLANEVPLILRREVYASTCIAGGALMALLHMGGIEGKIAALLAAALTISTRLLAIYYHWELPRPRH